jgi:hypothetical protein
MFLTSSVRPSRPEFLKIIFAKLAERRAANTNYIHEGEKIVSSYEAYISV